jgi:hypothetical protein
MPLLIRAVALTTVHFVTTRLEVDMSYDDYDPELDDLKAESRLSRQRATRLMYNPDCRDPDHPGCADCAETEEGDDEAAV